MGEPVFFQDVCGKAMLTVGEKEIWYSAVR
jgi:hypothetical protein